jgi:hypothetical protein
VEVQEVCSAESASVHARVREKNILFFIVVCTFFCFEDP